MWSVTRLVDPKVIPNVISIPEAIKLRDNLKNFGWSDVRIWDGDEEVKLRND